MKRIKLIIALALFGLLSLNVTYSQTPPAVPELGQPLDNSRVIYSSQGVQFIWQDSDPTATEYWIQVSDDPSFNSTLYDLSTGSNTQISFDGFTNGITYYWQVKAGNSDDPIKSWKELAN